MQLRRLTELPFSNCASLVRRCCSLTELPNLSEEQPDLPSWIRDGQYPEASGDVDGDHFVIPPIANWAQNPAINVRKQDAASVEEEENERVIRLMFNTVTSRYVSINSAVEALNEIGIRASNDLVFQLMRRLSNDWNSAFAVFIWAKNQTEYVHMIEQYEFMVDVLGKYKQFYLMWDLIREIIDLHGSVQLTILGKVMRRLAKARKYDEAVEVFHNIDQYGLAKDCEVLNTLMDGLVKEGNVELAHDIFAKFKDTISPELSSFNILVHGYCRARKLDDARKVIVDMENHGFTPDVVCYTSILEFLCKMKDFRNVKFTLNEMKEKGCTPNVITYTIVMHSLGKAKLMNEVLDLYEKMKQEGCKTDAPFYSSFIFILCKSGRFKDAWEVFEDMKLQSVSRDVTTYNTLISSLCKNMQEAAALELLRRMGEDSCKPNLLTFVPLIKLSCKLKRMKVLSFLFDHMFKSEISLDFSTYTVLIEGLLKSGQVKHSAFFFSQMLSKGMNPRRDTSQMMFEKLGRKGMAETSQVVQTIMSELTEKGLSS